MAVPSTHEGGLQTMFTPLGHAQASVGSSAVGLPSLPTPLASVRRATIRAVGQPINWRDDGVDPTGSLGMLLAAGDTLVYDGDMAKFKMIQDASATGASDVRVAYHGV